MNADWKAFLIENGAEFIAGDSNEQLVSFGNPESEIQISTQEALLSNPTDRGLIKIKGVDAESFLQNQLTNDIRNVTETQHQASAWCSPKGRIIANFRIFKRGESFYLSVSADLLEHVLKKLRLYVMMSKVTLEDVSDVLVHFSYAGEGAAIHLHESLGMSSSNETETIQHKSLSILRLSGPPTRFEIFGELDDAKKLWQQCKLNATPVSGMGSHYLNIISGNPEITAASSEAWIPQMINYIDIGGVDFKKGCYPGQEVVARLNYLGKTKRRMYRIQIDTDSVPKVGAIIKSGVDAEAGRILNAVINANGTTEALAVVKIAEANNTLFLSANNTGSKEAAISMLDLPYAVDAG